MRTLVSRSYRKPYWTEGMKSPGLRKSRRRQANRRVRKAKNVPDIGGFKKISNSWDICDYKFYDAKSSKVRRK